MSQHMESHKSRRSGEMLLILLCSGGKSIRHPQARGIQAESKKAHQVIHHLYHLYHTSIMFGQKTTRRRRYVTTILHTLLEEAPITSLPLRLWSRLEVGHPDTLSLPQNKPQPWSDLTTKLVELGPVMRMIPIFRAKLCLIHCVRAPHEAPPERGGPASKRYLTNHLHKYQRVK